MVKKNIGYTRPYLKELVGSGAVFRKGRICIQSEYPDSKSPQNQLQYLLTKAIMKGYVRNLSLYIFI